ncbi:MAG: threonine--tRNA ligase [Planctomycetota bacterium]
MNETLQVTLPDGSVRELPAGSTGLDLAASIGKGLLKAAVGIEIDGQIRSLQLPLEGDCTVSIITRDDPKALDIIRHSAAHVLADAVKQMRPKAKLWKGPPIDDPRYGYYYDIDVGDEGLSADDLPEIEKRMLEIIKNDVPFVFSELPRSEAKTLMEENGEVYKLATIDKIPEDEPITFYTSGEFVDLCEGPHVPSTGKLGKGVAVLSLAGAYFDNDASQQMLTRIYGHAFPDVKAMEEHRKNLEEAKKRDHRRLGIDLDLFSTMGDLGAGLVLWHPKGGFVRHKMEEFWRNEHLKGGYDLVNSPHVARSDLWKTSGHLDFYADSMFKGMDVDGADYLLKPMNCPFHVQIFKTKRRSYRELPFRWAELGTVYRYEEAGALHGLMRVRGFTQDDAHLFVRPDQLDEEIERVVRFVLHILRSFGFDEFEINLSTKPEKSVGDPKDWDVAEKALQRAIEKVDLPFVVDEGGGAFYGPKIDVKIKDSLGRMWQCSTIQLDFNLPERFDLSYIDQDGNKSRPFMLHRALLGSLERFFGILVENHGGAFPTWLAPVQMVLLPVGERHADYAEECAKALREQGFRVDADLSADKVGAKIRNHLWNEKVPAVAVLGDDEVAAKTLTVRDRKEGDLGAMTLEAVAERLQGLEASRS